MFELRVYSMDADQRNQTDWGVVLLLHSKFFPSHVFVCWCVFSGQSSLTRLPDWERKERVGSVLSPPEGSREDPLSSPLLLPFVLPSSFPFLLWCISLSADGLHFLLMSFICLASSQLSLPDAWLQLTGRRREKGNEKDRESEWRVSWFPAQHECNFHQVSRCVCLFAFSPDERREEMFWCSDGLSLISFSLQGRLEEKKRGRDEARTQLSIVIRAGGGYFYYYGTDERSSPSLFFWSIRRESMLWWWRRRAALGRLTLMLQEGEVWDAQMLWRERRNHCIL